jgi:hypothetical protein
LIYEVGEETPTSAVCGVLIYEVGEETPTSAVMLQQRKAINYPISGTFLIFDKI